MRLPSAASASSSERVNGLRWAILAMLFAATVLNYVDRQTLSMLASRVQRDLGIDDVGYARIVQFFLIAYAISYVAAGWITDKLGAKLTLALFLGWWSLADLATGWVRTAGQLGFARLMLGIGEPGVYTAGPKAIAEHFPPAETGFAIGVYTAGAMIGATIAPPLIGWLALQYGWRTAFFATGAAGLVWIAGWALVYRNPTGLPPARATEPIRWGPILRDRSVWGFALARLIADPVWYFYLFWFPKYLTEQRGMTLMQVAGLAWIVYLAADLGSVAGGVLSGRLIRAGVTPAGSRLIAMGGAACVAPLGALIALNPGTAPTLAIAAAVTFAHLVFQINIGTLAVDLYPVRCVATVFGLIAAGSALGGFASTQLVGRLASTGSYPEIFILMSLLHPLAWLIAWKSATYRRSVIAKER